MTTKVFYNHSCSICKTEINHYKKIIADIKKLKLKIQIKIQGGELRAEGKKRDDLQEAMSAISAIDIGLPIEFENFRD